MIVASCFLGFLIFSQQSFAYGIKDMNKEITFGKIYILFFIFYVIHKVIVK
jgi:hypothetical protein